MSLSKVNAENWKVYLLEPPTFYVLCHYICNTLAHPDRNLARPLIPL